MFAVPGWSVSNSDLKQQVEPVKEESQSRKNSKAKKRKRENDNEPNLSNVQDLYQQLVETNGGKSNTPKPEKESKKKNKKKDNAKSRNDGEGPSGNTTKGRVEKQANTSDGSAALRESEDAMNEDKGDLKQKKTKKRKTGKDHQGQREKEQDEQPSEQQQKPLKNKEEPASVSEAPAMTPASATPALTPLQQAMRQKLISARFRHLNETLYTTDSGKAMELFGSSPELFEQYHAGFTQQVNESWPSNPVDGYIKSVQTRGQVPTFSKKGSNPKHLQGRHPLPRRPNGLCTIADLGCGDARFARSLIPSAKKLNLSLLSYDLQAPDPAITKADISNLPLRDGSVDVVIFCLSLMGTNWTSFLEEAWRILRSDGKGECWISEVKSRFGKVTRKKGQIGNQKPLSKTGKKKLNKKNKRGGEGDDDVGSDVDDAEIYAEDARPSDNDETDVSAFVDVLRTRGFVLKPESLNKSNKMFASMEFVKQGGPPTRGKYASTAGSGATTGKKRFIEKTNDSDYDLSPEEEAKVLKPCLYKTR